MGLNLKDVVVREKTNLAAFNNRIVAIDAYNALYQFLSTIRGGEGVPLTDMEGGITSHLSGILYRNVNLLSVGIKPVWVFDGKPPSLKAAEIERRQKIKMDAAIKYEQAIADGDEKDARKYAQQTTSLKDDMIGQSKELLDLFGIPHIQAPSEGEATAANMTITGQAWASASQDYDSILFGARRLIRNFTSSGRRKVANRNFYVTVEPEIIYLEKVLENTEVSREQLVDAGIMIGTDFNPTGFRRIGPKTAIKLIKKHGRLEDIPQVQDELESTPYQDIRKIFLEPDVADEMEIQFKSIDYEGITRYMAGYDFATDRIEKALGRMKSAQVKKSQTLERWF